MTNRDKRKRTLPWMPITLLAITAFIAWRMAGVRAGGAGNEQANAMLQAGSQVTVRQESYACNTPDALSRSVAFKLAGAQDKLRTLVQQQECVLILPRQRVNVLALKDKLAQVESAAASAPIWMAARELLAADGPAQ